MEVKRFPLSSGPPGPGLKHLGPGLGTPWPGLGITGPGIGSPGPGLGITSPALGFPGPGLGFPGPGLGPPGPGLGTTVRHQMNIKTFPQRSRPVLERLYIRCHCASFSDKKSQYLSNKRCVSKDTLTGLFLETASVVCSS